MKRLSTWLIAICFMVPVASYADDDDPIMSLNHTVSHTVEHDVYQLRFLLVTPVMMMNDRKASAHLEAMDEDLSQIADSKFYKPAKFNYSSLTSRDKNRRYARTITFESKDFALLDTIYRELKQEVELKSELRFVGMNSFVSEETRAKQQDKMYEQLMQELLEKAQKLADYAGFDEAELIKVNVHQNHHAPRMIRVSNEMAVAKASSAPPALPTADRESRISVSADAQFKLDN